MPNCLGDRNCAALRYAQKGEPIDTRRIDDGLEIINEIFKRNVRNVAIRKPVAARVISKEAMIARQLPIKRPPNRTLEIEFEVGHPVAGFDDRRALTHL